MLYEYALDPNCLKDWKDFRFFMGQFGVSKGRLISRFPKFWLKMVYGACTGFTFIQKQKMVDILDKAKKNSLISSSRPYENSRSWKENAVLQHGIKPFHAIISGSNHINDADVLISDEIEESTHKWRIETQIQVERTAEALTGAVAPLLHISKKVIFIDKLFAPGRKRHLNFLEKCMNTACSTVDKKLSFEYHAGYGVDDGGREQFHENCRRYLTPIIPPHNSIEIFKIEKKSLGEGMHAGYILTDRGGVQIDWGLDTGGKGEKTIVSLLDEPLWKRLLETYRYPSEAFDLKYSVVVESNG